MRARRASDQPVLRQGPRRRRGWHHDAKDEPEPASRYDIYRYRECVHAAAHQHRLDSKWSAYIDLLMKLADHSDGDLPPAELLDRIERALGYEERGSTSCRGGCTGRGPNSPVRRGPNPAHLSGSGATATYAPAPCGRPVAF